MLTKLAAGTGLHALSIAVLALCTCAGPDEASAADTLGTIKQRDGVNIATDQISISGLSSGGWLAVQYHVAHSKQIMGVGVVAGGPYHCAGSSNPYCPAAPFDVMLPHDVCQATYVCSRFGGFYAGPPDVRDSIASARDEAKHGTIDPLAGLGRARVWIFTGGRETDPTHDGLMPHDVVAQVATFYAAFAQDAANNIAFVDTVDAAHAMPVAQDPTAEARNCDYFGEPYINNCRYAAAEKLLDFIYPGRATVSQSSSAEDRLQTFDQPVDATDPLISMNAHGHIYVPHACMQGQACPLHIALHGCSQDEQSLDGSDLPGGAGKFGDLPPQKRPYFFRAAGYNDWAEQHGVVVLYPQTRAIAYTLSNNGCWDWFGYSGPDYYVKSGKQIRAIDKMVECLTGEGACE